MFTEVLPIFREEILSVNTLSELSAILIYLADFLLNTACLLITLGSLFSHFYFLMANNPAFELSLSDEESFYILTLVFFLIDNYLVLNF